MVPQLSRTARTIVATVIVLAAVAAYVALALAGVSTGDYLGIVIPGLVGLVAVIVTGRVDSSNSAQLGELVPRLDTITSQTNGQLDARIERGVENVLTKFGLVGVHPAVTAAAALVQAVEGAAAATAPVVPAQPAPVEPAPAAVPAAPAPPAGGATA